MLKVFFANQIALGCAQAALTSLLALAVTLLARGRAVHLEQETVVALLRGIVQITGGRVSARALAPRTGMDQRVATRGNDGCCRQNVGGPI